MADNTVKIVITAEGKDARQAIENLNKQLQGTGKEADKRHPEGGRAQGGSSSPRGRVSAT